MFGIFGGGKERKSGRRGSHAQETPPPVFYLRGSDRYAMPAKSTEEIAAMRQREKEEENRKLIESSGDLDRFRDSQRAQARARLALDDEWTRLGNNEKFVKGMNIVRRGVKQKLDNEAIRTALVGAKIVSDEFVEGTIQTRAFVTGYQADTEQWNQILEAFNALRRK